MQQGDLCQIAAILSRSLETAREVAKRLGIPQAYGSYEELLAEAAGIDEDEVSAEVTKYFNHQQKLSGYVGPLLVMHTEHDGLIDISHAERNLNWAAGPKKRLVRFSQGDHNSIMAWNRDEYFEAIGAFVEGLNRTD